MSRLSKIAKDDSYGKTVAKVAPLFLLKPFLTDLPKKTLEEFVEQRGLSKLKPAQLKMLGIKKPKQTSAAKLLGSAFRGRGLATAAGAASIGALSAPLFLKGVNLLQSNKKYMIIRLLSNRGLSRLKNNLSEEMYENRISSESRNLKEKNSSNISENLPGKISDLEKDGNHTKKDLDNSTILSH